MTQVEPLAGRTLGGRFVALEPLAARHHNELMHAASDPAIWRYMPFDLSKDFASRWNWMIGEMEKGTWVSYAVRRLADDAIVGSTSYLAIAPGDAKLEIGATWYVAQAQGSAVNPEAKYLLLGNPSPQTTTA